AQAIRKSALPARCIGFCGPVNTARSRESRQRTALMDLRLDTSRANAEGGPRPESSSHPWIKFRIVILTVARLGCAISRTVKLNCGERQAVPSGINRRV